MTIKKIIVALIVVMAVLGKAAAQPYTLDKKIKPIELKMFEYKKAGDSLMNGKLHSSVFKQEKDTAYFFVKGAGIYQTVIVAIANKKSNQVLNVALCKDSWNKPDRMAKVESSKTYYEKFRTEGSFGIRVIPRQAKNEYQIMVWISDEPKNIKIPNAFRTKTTQPTKTKKKS